MKQIKRFGGDIPIFASEADVGYLVETGTDKLITADNWAKAGNSNFKKGFQYAGAETPVRADWNSLLMFISANISYIFQQGIPEWSDQATYYLHSFVSKSGIIYISQIDNNDSKNFEDVTKWIPLIQVASSSTAGIVALSSALDSMDESKASTPFAIKLLNDQVKSKLSLIDGGVVSGEVDFTGGLKKNGVDFPVPIETYATGDGTGTKDRTSWYRKWSDGFIEQAGWVFDNGSGYRIVNLLTPFETVRYNVQTTLTSDGKYGGGEFNLTTIVDSRTASSFSVFVKTGSNSQVIRPLNWYACGY